MKKLHVTIFLLSCLLPACVQGAAADVTAVARKLIRSIGRSNPGYEDFIRNKCQLARENQYRAEAVYQKMEELKDRSTAIEFNKRLTHFTDEDANMIYLYRVVDCVSYDVQFTSKFRGSMMRDARWSESGDSFSFYSVDASSEDAQDTWPTYTFIPATCELKRLPTYTFDDNSSSDSDGNDECNYGDWPDAGNLIKAAGW